MGVYWTLLVILRRTGLPALSAVFLLLVVVSLSLPALAEDATWHTDVRLDDALTRLSAFHGIEIRGIEATADVLVESASGDLRARLVRFLADFNYLMSESADGAVRRVIILGARGWSGAARLQTDKGKPSSLLEVKIVGELFDRAKFAGLVRSSPAVLIATLFPPATDAVFVSSGYGYRKHPILAHSAMHRGVDLAVREGTAVYAALDGRVDRQGSWGTYGKVVRIRHGPSVETLYAHLSGFAPGSGTGVRVKRGQLIGYVGSSGRSTGPHLHFEVLVAGREVDPLGYGWLGY